MIEINTKNVIYAIDQPAYIPDLALIDFFVCFHRVKYIKPNSYTELKGTSKNS